MNRQGESPLHIASRSGMSAVVRKLLDNGSDPNLQTPPPLRSSSISSPVKKKADESSSSSNPFGDDDEDEVYEANGHAQENVENIGLYSSIHLAVLGGFEDVILAFVEHSE